MGFITFSRLLLATGLVLLGAFAVTYYLGERLEKNEMSKGTNLSFRIETETNIGKVHIGQRDQRFEITNLTNRPSRILGIHETCQVGFCIESSDRSVILVQPGEKVLYTCALKIRRKGPFDADITFYFEDEATGVREQTVTVSGIGVTE